MSKSRGSVPGVDEIVVQSVRGVVEMHSYRRLASSGVKGLMCGHDATFADTRCPSMSVKAKTNLCLKAANSSWSSPSAFRNVASATATSMAPSLLRFQTMGLAPASLT